VIQFKVQYDVDLSPAERLKRYGFRKAIRIAVNRASAPAKVTMTQKAEAIRRFGFTAQSMRIRVRIYGDSERFVSIVGPTRSFKRVKGKYTRGPRKGQKRVFIPANTAHLADKGTKRSKAHHFVEKARVEANPRYLVDVQREVAKELKLELERQAGG
jgi:hypothetical protein